MNTTEEAQEGIKTDASMEVNNSERIAVEGDRDPPPMDTATSGSDESFQDTYETAEIGSKGLQNLEEMNKGTLGNSTSSDMAVIQPMKGTEEVEKEPEEIELPPNIESRSPDVLLEEPQLHVEEEMKPLEVPYKDRTGLFLDIESCNWNEVIAKTKLNMDLGLDVQEARTWVVASRNDSGKFSKLIKWRRLPLHEACRRQAPVEVVEVLLSAFSEGAWCQTHFGETPLHLACSSGAPLAVVNLLLSAYPHAVTTKDNARRTPMKVIAQSGKKRSSVQDSLKRCADALIEQQAMQKAQVSKMKLSGKKAISRAKSAHKEELTRIGQDMDHLRDELDVAQKSNAELRNEMKEKEAKLQSKVVMEEYWMEIVKELKKQVAVCRTENTALNEQVESLSKDCSSKDEEIKVWKSKVEQLQTKSEAVSTQHEKLIEKMARIYELRIAVAEEQRLVANLMDEQSVAISSLFSEDGLVPTDFPKTETC